MGIYQMQPNQKRYPINWEKTFFLIGCIIWSYTTVAVLAFEETSMFVYGFSFYILTAIFNCLFIYFQFIWQLENTLKFIKNCEEFIGMSKYYCTER